MKPGFIIEGVNDPVHRDGLERDMLTPLALSSRPASTQGFVSFDVKVLSNVTATQHRSKMLGTPDKISAGGGRRTVFAGVRHWNTSPPTVKNSGVDNRNPGHRVNHVGRQVEIKIPCED
eukprot:6476172-Amphidinium_carterae.1